MRERRGGGGMCVRIIYLTEKVALLLPFTYKLPLPSNFPIASKLWTMEPQRIHSGCTFWSGVYRNGVVEILFFVSELFEKLLESGFFSLFDLTVA